MQVQESLDNFIPERLTLTSLVSDIRMPGEVELKHAVSKGYNKNPLSNLKKVQALKRRNSL